MTWPPRETQPGQSTSSSPIQTMDASSLLAMENKNSSRLDIQTSAQVQNICSQS